MAPLEQRSLFSFHRVAAAAFAAPDRPFFWMQDHWPTLRRVLIEEFSERGSMRQASRHDVAGKRLGFHDRHIRFAGNGKKIVSRSTMNQAGCPEVIRHRNLVQCFPVEPQWPNPAANKRAYFNRRAQSDDANIIAILDLELARKLGRNLSKHLRLQFRQMTQETRHAASGMVFGQAVGRENIRKSWVTRRREAIFLTRKPALRGIRVVRVKFIRHRRFERFVMSRERPVLQAFWYIKPTQSVLMQYKWRIAWDGVETFCVYVGLVVGRFPLYESGNIDA